MNACVLSHFSRVQLYATPWAVGHRSPLPMGFSRQEYWSGLPCPLLGDLLNPGIEPRPSTCRQILYHLSHQGSPNYALLSWKPGLILLWLLLISIQTHRLLSLWDFPGKNTGVGCHALFQGIFLTQGLNLHLYVSSIGRWVLYH